MRTKYLRLVMVVATAWGMAGCVHIWTAGPPCVGNSCPTGAGGSLPGVSGQVAEQRPVRVAQPPAAEVAVAQPASVDQASAAAAPSSAPTDAQASAPAQASAQASDANAAPAATPAAVADANAAPAADGQANSAPASNIQANNAQPNAQEKPGKFTRLLQALHLHSKS